MDTEQAPYSGHCQGKMVVTDKSPYREGSVEGTERQLMTNKLTWARGRVKIAVWILNKHLKVVSAREKMVVTDKSPYREGVSGGDRKAAYDQQTYWGQMQGQNCSMLTEQAPYCGRLQRKNGSYRQITI